MSGLRWGAVLGLVLLGVLWMSWPLPLELGSVWTSARVEGDLAWSLVLHRWATDALTGTGSWTSDPRVWSPEGGSLATSAWNLVALGSTAWLGWGTSALMGWHRSMLFVGFLNGLGGAWLGHRLGGWRGAIVGATACACAPTAWFEMCEGRLEQGLIAPMAVWLAEAHALLRAPRPLTAGLALGLVAGTDWFLGPVAVLVGVPLMLLGVSPTAPRPRFSRVGAGLAGCVVLVILGLLPIAEAIWSGAGGAAVVDPVLGRTQRIASSISPLAQVVGGHLPAHRIPLVALAWLPLAWRETGLRPWLAALGLASVLAAGPLWTWNHQPLMVSGMELSLPLRLLDVLPGFSRFWWPDRIVAVAGLVAAGGLCLAVSAPSRPRWLVGLVVVLLAADGRYQLRNAIELGDPRIPVSALDPARMGGFYAPPAVPSSPGTAPALVGPWSQTANLLPLISLETGRPLLRGDGAADRRLWPASFTQRVDSSPLLTALSTGGVPTAEAAEQLDGLKVDTVYWLGETGRDHWSRSLGCLPRVEGPWAIWDRRREDCR